MLVYWPTTSRATAVFMSFLCCLSSMQIFPLKTWITPWCYSGLYFAGDRRNFRSTRTHETTPYVMQDFVLWTSEITSFSTTSRTYSARVTCPRIYLQTECILLLSVRRFSSPGPLVVLKWPHGTQHKPPLTPTFFSRRSRKLGVLVNALTRSSKKNEHNRHQPSWLASKIKEISSSRTPARSSLATWP